MITNSSNNNHRFEEDNSIVYVENLLSGVNEWRNIQEIVRSTFRALTDVIRG